MNYDYSVHDNHNLNDYVFLEFGDSINIVGDNFQRLFIFRAYVCTVKYSLRKY